MQCVSIDFTLPRCVLALTAALHPPPAFTPPPSYANSYYFHFITLIFFCSTVSSIFLTFPASKFFLRIWYHPILSSTSTRSSSTVFYTQQWAASPIWVSFALRQVILCNFSIFHHLGLTEVSFHTFAHIASFNYLDFFLCPSIFHASRINSQHTASHLSDSFANPGQ